MNKNALLFIIILICITNTKTVYAGRGCCSWHGGQSYCGSDGYWYCNDGTRNPTCRCNGGNDSSIYQKQEVYGCTDSSAYNYNPNATKNDGSCIKKVYGCMNKDAYNYNEKANIDDNSCIDKVYGCLDKKAFNYNQEANTQDGSCLYREEISEIKKINYKTKKKYSFFKKEGKVIRKGKKGKKEITYEIIKNEKSEIIEKNKIKEEIIKKPVSKIISTRKK